MTEDEIKQYLKKKRCPELVWRGGSQRLVEQWTDFVSEVERGYCPNCLIDEYWNDLDTRELIHEIGCDAMVKEADARFAAMLTATHIKHYHKDRHSSYDFWNYGYPKNAGGDFYQQVRVHILQQS